MTGMDKISGAILDKVKIEAAAIISDAEARAKEEIAVAEKTKTARAEAQKNKLLDVAKAEAGRILAQSSIKSRQQLLTAKADIIEETTEKVRKAVVASKSSDVGMAKLIKEALSGLNTKDAILYVRASDVDMAKKVVAADKKLADMVNEVKETECTGGVIAEDTIGKTRIDNTFDTRQDILLPKLMPEVSKELFENI
jgi:vacuolar-type H+-ATPase subunit E/Vma4